MRQVARDWLIDTYIDWVNNYISIAVYAEHHGLTPDQAKALLDLARDVVNSEHPEA